MPHSRNTVCIKHRIPLAVIWGRTWNNLRWRSVYRNPSSLPLTSAFFFFPPLAGSTLSTVTEWSQPSLVFSVRSKKRQVSFLFWNFTSSLCIPYSVPGCWSVVRLCSGFSPDYTDLLRNSILFEKSKNKQPLCCWCIIMSSISFYYSFQPIDWLNTCRHATSF